MGSESSKPNRTDDRRGVDALRFGPQQNVEQNRSSEYSYSQPQIPQNSMSLNSQHPRQSCVQQSVVVNPQAAQNIPPPVYSRVDPVPKPQKTIIQQKSAQQASQNIKDQGNPYTWVSPDIAAPGSTKISQPKTVEPLKSIPVQSTTYLSANNPFVWTRTDSCEAVNFDQELPKIKQNLQEEKNNAAIKFDKELNKNKSLADIRKVLVNNEYLSDIRLILGSKTFYAHKMFLVTASPLFHQHFQVDGKKELKIEGITEENLLSMLNFIYSGNLHKLTDDNILSTIEVADKLKIVQIYSAASNFVNSKINPDGVFVVLEKAIQLNDDQFQKKCLDYLKKNEEKCFNSNGFFKIGLISLITILEKCDYPSEKSNEIIEKWNHGPTAVKPKVPNKAEKSNSKPKKGNPQQQQAAKQRSKNHTKQMTKATSIQNIPNLMDLSIPPPPFAEGFQSSHSDSMNQLLIFGIDDDEKCKSNNDLVCVDDEENGRVKVEIRGSENYGMTEFSRIDFFVKRSFLLHEFWFNQNMIGNVDEVRISVSIYEGDKRSDIHNRVIKKQPGITKLNFVKFSQKPLKFYIGQKFFIKLNFNKQAARKHLDPSNLSSTDFVELRKDDEVRKYFNCVSKLVVSEMT